MAVRKVTVQHSPVIHLHGLPPSQRWSFPGMSHCYFATVSCTLGLLVDTATKTKSSAAAKYHQSVSLSFCRSCYRIFADDDAQLNIRPIFLALAHPPRTLLRRISLITNGASQSSIKFGQRGRPRLSVLLLGRIPEAQEVMQVPNQDIWTGAEANIMCAMG